jgi:phage gp16-like protein
MITRDQIKLIWVLARQLGMESDELHEMVSVVTGKDSIKSLSVTEGAEVIEVLVRAGGRVKKKRKPRLALPPNVVELVTHKQTRLIKRLEKRLGWQDNPQRLKGFTKRIIKREGIRTKQEAIKVIEGLKSMARRESKKDVVNGTPV